MEARPATSAISIRRLALLVVLPLLLLGAVHLFSQQYGTAMPPQVLRLAEARLLPGDALDPAQIPGALLDPQLPAPAASAIVSRPLEATATPTPMPSTAPTTPVTSLAPGHVVALPVQIHDTDAPGPLWFALDFRLDRPAQVPYWLVYGIAAIVQDVTRGTRCW